MSKSILITGASGNLGSVVTETLLSQGYTIFATKSPGNPIVSDNIHYMECDLTYEASVLALFQQLKEKTNDLAAVICLAGGFDMSNISNTSSKSMMEMLQINYFTAFHVAHFACPWMSETKGGKLIFIGAKPVMEGNAAEMLSYTVSKSAVIKLAEIINEDTTLNNINASVIIPSIIDTPLNRKYMPDADFSKWITPAAIASHISFLLSEQSNGWKAPILKLYNGV